MPSAVITRPLQRLGGASLRLMLFTAAMALIPSPSAGQCGDEDRVSLFLAGDMIVMRPLSDVDDARFLELIEAIRRADVAVVNLETLFHRFEGYPQADSGGTYMATAPEIADDLAWAGIDMVSSANNHAFDYGAIGVIENLTILAEADIIAAGTGADLQRARAARFFRKPPCTVALISAASSFVPYGKASRSRPDMRGRPGLNPLATVSHVAVDVPAGMADALGWLARRIGFSGKRFANEQFDLFDVEFNRGRPFALHTGERADPEDLSANLATIGAASQEADVTIVAIHAHLQGQWLTDVAHQAIDAGADIVIAHGPHEVRGIELYRGRPIFYSLGDFFYEQYHIERLPAEFYDAFGLDDDLSAQEAVEARFETIGRLDERAVWEGLGAVVEFQRDALRRIRLIPLDLGFDAPLPERGRPRIAAPALGASIIDRAKSASDNYGTEVVYLPADNIGLISGDGAAE